MIRIKFDENNTNVFNIYSENKLIKTVVCPPVEYSTDIITLTVRKVVSGYTHNFDGLVVITSPKYRKVYYKGRTICISKREPEKTLLDFEKSENPAGKYMTFKDLKDIVSRLDSYVVDSAPIFGERIEDFYFEQYGWDEYKKEGRGSYSFYHPCWHMSYEKESGIVFFNFHY